MLHYYHVHYHFENKSAEHYKAKIIHSPYARQALGDFQRKDSSALAGTYYQLGARSWRVGSEGETIFWVKGGREDPKQKDWESETRQYA